MSATAENQRDMRSPILDRAFLRARLAAVRKRGPRGDAATATRLMEAQKSDGAALQPFEQAKYGPVTWTTTPYDKVTGEPVVTATPKIPAAVLVPLVDHGSGFTVLLTQRTADLKSHAGRISFPGGRMEPEDGTADINALRETEEEIGLARSYVEIIGHLDPYITVSGYEVTPVVGVVTPPFDLTPDPVEVADIFEVPLSFFLDPANHQRHSRTVAEGITRAYYAMPYGDRYIWGATAGMLVNLYEVLTGS
jgi:8-oxo-dGTP pyrophosphatase MutT (NUDIX family)